MVLRRHDCWRKSPWVMKVSSTRKEAPSSWRTSKARIENFILGVGVEGWPGPPGPEAKFGPGAIIGWSVHLLALYFEV